MSEFNDEHMDLIPDMDMPPFARMAWVSNEAKEAWEPVLRLASEFYDIMESLSVYSGVRDVMTTSLYPEELVVKTREDFAENNIHFAPIAEVGDYEGFAHYHPPVEEGKPWHYYGPLGRPEAVNQFVLADAVQDHEKMGELLGFPKCCTTFFQREWTKGYNDPIWQIAMNTPEENVLLRDKNFIRLKAYPEVLSLLRYNGPRFTFHIPCSTTCEASKKVAEKWVAVARKYGYHEQVDALYEVLSWPVEWNVLHGIAEVKTPVFKIVTNSVYSKEKYTVQIEGSRYPEYAATGLAFPFRKPSGVKITESKSFERAERDIKVD